MRFNKLYTIISTLTLSEMKGRYRNTWAGFLWVILNPIIMFSVHALVFKYILKIDIDRYYVFLLGGLLPWIFINQTLSMTVHSLITYREVLMSFQVQPLAILSSKIIDNFFNFLCPFFLLFFILLFSEGFPLSGIISLPISMILLVVGTFSIALFCSTLQVYFRDTQFILTFVLNILYFLTPIFYPPEMIPGNFAWIIDINPFYALIRPFQVALYQYDSAALAPAILKSALCNIVLLVISLSFWRSKRNELYLYI